METLSTLTGSPCWLLNDAQAASLWAEYYHRRDTISDMAFSLRSQPALAEALFSKGSY